MTASDPAATFRALHRTPGSILVLPNAWDAMSARVIEEAGARAIATTSSGVSWALGRPDGHGLSREEMVDAVRRIARVVRVPVTADVEGGYGDGTPADVEATVRGVIGAGAVGINLEDGTRRPEAPLLESGVHARRIAAARKAADAEGVALFVNARVDVYLRQVGAEPTRFDETVRRAREYVAGGADGVFVPGLVDPLIIGRLVEAVGAPLNVMAGPGAPSVPALQELGVARVSLGPAVSQAVLGHIRRAAVEVLGPGTYHALEDAMPWPGANGLF